MSLDFPVFDTKNLKRFYYYFITFILLLAAATIACDLFAKSLLGKPLLNDKFAGWALIAVALFLGFYFGNKSKKELKLVQEAENWDEKFTMYERYYKRKLIWNAFIIVLNCAFLLGSTSGFFMYFLIFQVLISLVFYPGKTLLTKELKTQEIIIT
ncbi:MAG TPA: hypothetical protein VFZ47_09745 [Chitinophagaceae bacterium]